MRGNFEKAKRLYTRLIEISNDGSSGQIAAYGNIGNIGNIYRANDELDKAENYYRKALELNKIQENDHGIAAGYGSLGNVYYMRCDWSKAEEYYLKALKIEEKLDLHEGMGIANAYGNLSNDYELNDFEKAEKYVRKSLDLNVSAKHIEGIAGDYRNLGRIFGSLGAFDKAEEYLRESLRLFTSIGATPWMENCRTGWTIWMMKERIKRHRSLPKSVNSLLLQVVY